MKDPKPVKCPKCGELMFWMKPVEMELSYAWVEEEKDWVVLDDMTGLEDCLEDVEKLKYHFRCSECDKHLYQTKETN